MISIIIPVYNVKLYLDNCIQSVIQQSYTDFECILVDDGSTDNEHRLGAVKDIQVALEAIKGRSGESFLVIAGDNLLDFSFREFIQFSQKKQAPCVMCHEENDLKRQQKTAIIVKDADDKIISYEEKPRGAEGKFRQCRHLLLSRRRCGTDRRGN